MRHFQRFPGESQERVGDGFSAALASLLELPLTEEPHFANDSGGDPGQRILL